MDDKLITDRISHRLHENFVQDSVYISEIELLSYRTWRDREIAILVKVYYKTKTIITEPFRSVLNRNGLAKE